MRIMMIGTGAIGSLYGGWLLAAGGEVSFVARGRRFAQLRQNGLSVEGQSNLRFPEVVVAQHATDLPPADIIIFAVKLYDLEQAARSAACTLAPGGLVVGLQNGVDTAATLGTIFDPAQVMVGPVYSAAVLGVDGTVRHQGSRNDVVIGNVAGLTHPHAQRLIALWQKAGVAASLSSDINSSLWTKFLVLATNAALTCLARQPAGIVYHDPLLLDLARRSIAEIAAVAKAEGVGLAPDAEAEALTTLQNFHPDVVASMRQDLDAGRRLELEGISGTVVRLGRDHSISTPVHDVAYACLKPFVDGRGSKAE